MPKYPINGENPGAGAISAEDPQGASAPREPAKGSPTPAAGIGMVAAAMDPTAAGRSVLRLV